MDGGVVNSLEAFARAQGARGQPAKVFDWHRAARRIKETGARHASAGLSDDWEWTGGDILRDGKPPDRKQTQVYLASVWATPELNLDGAVEDCFIMQAESPGWDARTYWPQSALDILGPPAPEPQP